MAIALIVAAGRGERLGAGAPKALVPVAGRPLLDWSVSALAATPQIERIVVALPHGVPAPRGTTGVIGGRTRSHSVALALAAAPPAAPSAAPPSARPRGAGPRGAGSEGAGPDGLVLVHDAARPMLDGELIERTLQALAQDERLDAVTAAVPVTDTIKRVQDGAVIDTLERSQLWAVQTPQVFRRSALERALDVDDEVLAMATDDAWLVERIGGRVGVVSSSPSNIKVTTELDLRLAELLLGAPPA